MEDQHSAAKNDAGYEDRGANTEGDTRPGSGSFSQEKEFDHELERRLRIIEAPDYTDPARADLPALDLYLLVALVVVTTVVMYIWGH